MLGLFITLGFALFFFAAALAALARVDSVIREIYASDRQRWQELGSPMGFFWRSRETTPFLQSVNARNDLVMTALLRPRSLKRHTAESPPNPLVPTPGSIRSEDDGPQSGVAHL